jgi:pentatricopeptide repeat protein
MLAKVLGKHNISDAMQIIAVMKQKKCEPDDFTYAILLNCCDRFRSLEQTKVIHGYITESGKVRDIVTYRLLLQLYLKFNQIQYAIDVLKTMTDGGIVCDNKTLTLMLMACAEAKSKYGKLVHQYIIETELEQDIFIKTALVKMYAASNDITAAMRVFNSVSKPDTHLYTCILQACANTRSLEYGRQIHKALNSIDGMVANSLIRMYFKCDAIEQAINVFESMDKKQVDNYTYSIMWSGCAKATDLEYGRQLHNYVKQNKIQLDVQATNSLVEMYAKCNQLEEALNVLETMTRPDDYTYSILLSSADNIDTINLIISRMPMTVSNKNNLIRAYIRCNATRKALSLFHTMDPDDLTCSAMIGAVADLDQGMNLYNYIRQRGIQLMPLSRLALISMFLRYEDIDMGLKLFFDAIRDNIDVNNATVTLVLYTCTKNNLLQDGTRVRGYIEHHWDKWDLITMTTLIQFNVAAHEIDKAMQVFHSLVQKGCELDDTIYTVLLDGIAERGILSPGVQVYNHMIATKFDPSQNTMAALVDMFGRCGDITQAKNTFDKMLNKWSNVDVVSYTCMILAYGIHGYGKEALQVFNDMISKNIQPTAVSFSAVLTACGHAGLVSDATNIFSQMESVHGIKPQTMHYNCMVDALARWGHLEEAENMIMSMERRDIITWTSLLGPCKQYNDVERAQRAAVEIKKIAPNDAAARVILAQVYNYSKRHQDAKHEWLEMKSHGIKKTPGITEIDLLNGEPIVTVYARSYPEKYKREIISEMKVVYDQITRDGFVANTSVVTEDVDDSTKQLMLSEHSEKISLVLGLLKVPQDKEIRLSKNLKVCSDCHSFMKAVSKVRDREIVMRDAKRFHHFKNGKCTCNDKW